MLELRDVVKHYRNGGEQVRAVDRVSLDVGAGEMLALLGPSGSGKTTLLLLIGAVLRADAGTIGFEGRDLSTLSDRQVSEYLLRDVGFIHQRVQLMGGMPALENACRKLLLRGAGLREARAAALPWLERVGLGGQLERLPGELSGGERQRLAIARALAGEPRLILADEPTGSLDSERSREIVALLRSLAHDRGAAVVLVTHDPAAAAVADRRLTLRDGRLDRLEHERDRPLDGAPAVAPGA
jgi:putative ABC transport system ATP-binding protein